MTALSELLRQRIRQTGPIGLDVYMTECLLHPRHGYYTRQQPFGAKGDFTTAPEITQMFGELLGLWLAQCWMDRGAPDPFVLAELGPGRGTLMADVLRATARVPGFHQAARLTLVEASPALRKVQAETLGPDPLPHDVTWLDRAEDLPAHPAADLQDAPLFLLANEFFDALPIRQFQRHAEGWQERVVGLDPSGAGLVLGLTPPARLGELAHRLADTGPGDVVEIRPAADAVLSAIAARIATRGGVALIADYGDWQSLGDTFQALQGHAPVDPLAAPGQADLTAHVDFAALARAASQAGARATAMQTQGDFLLALGLAQRTKALADTLAAHPETSGAALDSHLAAYRRLTHPDEMGSLFKTLALYSPDTPAPPGFGS